MDTCMYRRGETLHVRNDEGQHWTAHYHPRSGQPYHRPIGRSGMKLYGRPSGYYGWRQNWRGFQHGLMNAALQEGSWSWYLGRGDRKMQLGEVRHQYIPARNHTKIMEQETLAETGQSLSATDYARLGHGAWGTGGHSAIRYEWCHLVAHGLGGPDHRDNLVAATCFQNTEQLVIEAVLHEYRMEGLDVRVSAKMASGTVFLAESIYYEVLLGDQCVYGRTMDARRATNVSYAEVRDVARGVRAQINLGLARHFPADDVDDDLKDHVLQELDAREIGEVVDELRIC